MAPPGFGDGLDTPRTNLGDATFLSRQPDFDMSQEISFHSPTKDNNLLHQLRTGRPGGISLRTPNSRAPLRDRRNLPAGIGGAEFTPMLKSATRNSALRGFGKENGGVPNTPALGRIDEDMTPIPTVDTSRYSQSVSYVDNTLPQVDTSSATSTPMVLLERRRGDKGPLQDGKQLSLREQESVIDKIEKENFGLKLKIHFLEEALRKAGPDFNNEALKENTELKVDKVTMHRELQKYKKHLTSAEKDLESYRHQMLQLQERARKKYADREQQAEIERLQAALEDKDAKIDQLQLRLEENSQQLAEADRLRDETEDLAADLREKETLIGEQEDQIEELLAKLDRGAQASDEHDHEVEKLNDRILQAEESAKNAQRRVVELEHHRDTQHQADESRATIQDLESEIRNLKTRAEELRETADSALAVKQQAEYDLQELKNNMADKSIVPEGFSRQNEERLACLQADLEQADTKFAALEKHMSQVSLENQDLKNTLDETRQTVTVSEQERQTLLDKVERLRKELQARLDEKILLQNRHDALTNESSSLQRNVSLLQESVQDLEDALSQEREHALQIDRDVRQQYQTELERLNDEVTDLQAEIRERDNLYDNDSEQWETDRKTLEVERDRAMEKAAGLESTIEKLRQADDNLSDKENKFQEALRSEAERHKSEKSSLERQIEDLHASLVTRQSMLTDLRNELSTTQDQLRQMQVDYRSQIEKVEALEDEVEVLQSTLDDAEQSREVDRLRADCHDLQTQLASMRELQDHARISFPPARDNENPLKDYLEHLEARLNKATYQSTQHEQQKQELAEKLSALRAEMRSVQDSLAETNAERDELFAEMRRLQTSGKDNLHVDRERLELRAAKTRLDGEIRRLKEENSTLEEQRRLAEKALAEEMDKATDEEERLNQEVLDLKLKLRDSSSSEGQETLSARRTIRDLERRIKEYEHELEVLSKPGLPAAVGDSSELSLMRRDLAAARQRETNLAERDAAHEDVVKSLRRQILDLERKVHDAEMSKFNATPDSSSASTRRSEVSDLRTQLSSAHQSIYDLKLKSRDSERKASKLEQDFRARFEELEEQKLSLEQALEDVQRDADEAVVLHEKAVRRLDHKLQQSRLERRSALSVSDANRTLPSSEIQHALRKAHSEIGDLEHDIIQQKETIDGLSAAEESLRRKLERARSERAAYRASAEKLQKDIKDMKASAGAGQNQSQVPVRFGSEAGAGPSQSAIETVIRAAESAEKRHLKEIRGMALQMAWMQARWEREVSMRGDVAYAKKFIQLELDVAHACNKAQLRELEVIRTEVLGSRKMLMLPSDAVRQARTPAGRPTLKTVAIAARFVARLQSSAKEWARHETTRKKLANSVEEMRKAKRKMGLKVVRDDVAV